MREKKYQNMIVLLMVVGVLLGNSVMYVQAETSVFTDVSEADWYYKPVNFVNNRGIMTGMTKDSFGPAVNLQRSHFAT